MKSYLKNMCRVEIKRSLKHPLFKIAVLLNLIFMFTSLRTELTIYYQDMRMIAQHSQSGNQMIEIYSLYNYWVGADKNSAGSQLFYFLLPLMSCFAYSWSYVEEKKGHMINIIIRSKKKDYFIAKYIACFLSGGLTIVLPLLINILVIAMCIPARIPDVYYEIYNGITCQDLWSNIFYQKPLLYLGMYVVLDFIFAGLFSCLGYALGTIAQRKITVMALPFIGILVLHYARSFSYYKFYKEVSPLNYLHAVQNENPADIKIIFLEGMMILICSIMLLRMKGLKKDVL